MYETNLNLLSVCYICTCDYLSSHISHKRLCAVLVRLKYGQKSSLRLFWLIVIKVKLKDKANNQLSFDALSQEASFFSNL